jgi:hypothetical protein
MALGSAANFKPRLLGDRLLTDCYVFDLPICDIRDGGGFGAIADKQKSCVVLRPMS